MFCKNCGKETLNENGLCNECEAEMNHAETVNPTVENTNEATVEVVPGKGKGIVALVFGILGLASANLIFAIIAMVFGKKAVGTEGEKFGKIGRKLGIAGLILGCIAVVVYVILIIVYIAIYATVIFAALGGSIE